MFEEIMNHPTIHELVNRFDSAGFELFLVGGSVRDTLAGQESKDMDLCTDATVEEFGPLLEGLGTIFEAGKRFGTLVVVFGQGEDDRIEITTFRTEIYNEDSRKPEVAFSRKLGDDLKRRDFTVNAMAVNLKTGELSDLHEGQKHLSNQILDTPGDPDVIMSDDPLRAVRAVRFSATRKWKVAPRVTDAIIRNRERLQVVSRERVTAELTKIVNSQTPDALVSAVLFAEQCEIAEAVFGPLRPVKQFRSTVTGNVIDRLTALALAAEVDPDATRDIVDSLKLPANTVKGITRRLRLVARFDENVDDSTLREIVRSYTVEEIQGSLQIGGHSQELSEHVKRIMGESDITKTLPVDGNDLLQAGLTGRDIGKALKALETERCNHATFNRQDAFAFLENR